MAPITGAGHMGTSLQEGLVAFGFISLTFAIADGAPGTVTLQRTLRIAHDDQGFAGSPACSAASISRSSAHADSVLIFASAFMAAYRSEI